MVVTRERSDLVAGGHSMAAGKLIREAADKKQGMTAAEVMDAIVAARNNGMPTLTRTTVGFKGQIQTMTFEGVDPHVATTRVGEERGPAL